MRRTTNAPIAIPTIAPVESPPLDFDEEAAGLGVGVPVLVEAVTIDDDREIVANERGNTWPSIVV